MTLHSVLTSACRAALKVSGHRLCCDIPGWLAGPNWEPVNINPWNPYNVVSRFGQLLVRHGEA